MTVDATIDHLTSCETRTVRRGGELVYHSPIWTSPRHPDMLYGEYGRPTLKARGG